MWDNFNSSMEECTEHSSLFPLSGIFDNKIIAYGGTLPLDAPDRPANPSAFLENCIVTLGIKDDHRWLRCASVLLYEALNDPSEYGQNDGMVPVSSSLAYGHDIDHHHLLEDFDHGEMKGDGLTPSDARFDQLYGPLVEDLTSIYNEFHLGISAPDYVTVLNAVMASATGKIDGVEPYSWEWDFAYDGTFNAEASGKAVTISAERYKYDSGNTKTIALRPNGDDSKIQTKQIFIRPYPISVSFPDGYTSLHRHFSTPSSSLIDTYTWNYGDGSAPETGSTESHTYSTSGYYTVTLTLTLEDGSSISSQQGIFVGPGTRYIQAHTIYGDETWYAGGTYVVQGTVTIAQGACLTIEDGVEVQLSSGVQISAFGTLNAKGATFTWSDGENQWYGIVFTGASSSGSRLENCIIEHAAGFPQMINAYWYHYGILQIFDSSPTIQQFPEP